MHEDSLLQGTGYRSSMGRNGDNESSIFGWRGGDEVFFSPAGLDEVIGVLKSAMGLSYGNAKKDDTGISVCLHFLLYRLWG